MLPAILIFGIVYLFIASERIHKTIAALIGAGLILLFHIMPYESAVDAVDLNVIFLLVGMMIEVNVLAQTGFFEWIAISLARRADGKPIRILLILVGTTALLSAFLDNVTTVILVIPVTILVTKILEIEAVPFLIFEAIASNIGGTATLIGDPPNVIIGSAAGMTFMDFLIHLTPATVFIMIVFLGVVYITNRGRFRIDEHVRLRIREAIPHLAILDRRMMIRSLVVIGMTMIGFVLHGVLGIEAGVIALMGAMMILLVNRVDVEGFFRDVEWGVLFFFIGLFILVGALEYTGVIRFLAGNLISLSADNLFYACMLLLWGSALSSSILDNIPIVMALIPMVEVMISHFGTALGISDPLIVRNAIAQPLWWSLALGACLGGNGTLIGASANVVTARIGESNDCPISFMRFTRTGFPYMLLTVVIASFYIWIRYFQLQM